MANEKTTAPAAHSAPAEAPKKERKKREARPVTVRGVAVKVADLLEKLPAELRAKAVRTAKGLAEVDDLEQVK